MGGTNAQLPFGQQVSLPGHFAPSVVLESATRVAQGYLCRVRLPDGTMQKTTISLEEAATLTAEKHPVKLKPIPPATEPCRLSFLIQPEIPLGVLGQPDLPLGNKPTTRVSESSWIWINHLPPSNV